MANQVVSQMKKEEEELEALKKAYEDKKKEVANKKRAYTKLVNQTEDMKKELESLYESLEKGPYKKTARFDSAVYDRIAELEEAIRVNDEKLGRERITYTETTTTVTKTVTVEQQAEPVAQPVAESEDLLLSDTAKEELKVMFAMIDQLAADVEDIKNNQKEIKDEDRLNFYCLSNLMTKTKENLYKELGDRYVEIAELAGDGNIPNVDVLREKLGIEKISLADLSKEEYEEAARGFDVRISEASDEWSKYWQERREAEEEKVAKQDEEVTKTTIDKIQTLVHAQTRKEFQYLGLDPVMYLSKTTEIEAATVSLTPEQKEQVEIAQDAVFATLDKIEDGATYEEVRDEFIRQIDFEKDTFKDDVYEKVKEIKKRLDKALQGAGEQGNLRQRFKQKRVERQLAEELGIKRKELTKYQKVIDDVFDRYNDKGENYRTYDVDTLFVLADILEIEDDAIERFEVIDSISTKAYELRAYEKYVDAMQTEEHIEASKEKLKNMSIYTVEAKSDEYDWSQIDVSKIDAKDIERLDRLGLEVHDLLQETYDEYDEEHKKVETKAKVVEKKYDKIDELIEVNTQSLINFYDRRYDLSKDQDAEQDQDADQGQEAEEDQGEELE